MDIHYILHAALLCRYHYRDGEIEAQREEICFRLHTHQWKNPDSNQGHLAPQACVPN